MFKNKKVTLILGSNSFLGKEILKNKEKKIIFFHLSNIKI